MTPDRPISDELLQRYFDGELSPDERSDVEGRLDADARLRLEALGELRGLLRAHAADEAVDLSSAIDAIERAEAPKAAAPPAPRRRWIPMSAMGGLLAAAAALVLFLRPGAPTVVPGHNRADVESLEVEGTVATVMKVGDGDDEATVIWADDSPTEPSSDNDETSE